MTSDEKFRALVAHPYADQIAAWMIHTGYWRMPATKYADQIVSIGYDVQNARARARGRA